MHPSLRGAAGFQPCLYALVSTRCYWASSLTRFLQNLLSMATRSFSSGSSFTKKNEKCLAMSTMTFNSKVQCGGLCR